MEIELTSEGKARFGKIKDLRREQYEAVAEPQAEIVDQFARLRRLMAPLQNLIGKIIVIEETSWSEELK